MINIAFCGTDIICLPFLLELINTPGINIKTILTKDKSQNKSRKKIVNLGSFLADNQELFNGIEKIYPINMRQIDENIFNNIDAVIVMAYGHKIPQRMLDKCPWINIHASLLPAWRGACPINYSLRSGDTESGLTAILMANEIDAGDILGKIITHIDINDNIATLTTKLTDIGPKWFTKVLIDYLDGKILPVQQNHALATFTKMLNTQDRIIKWSQSALNIHNQIRSMSPYIGCVININDIKIKIVESIIEDYNNIDMNNIGKIISEDKLIIQCGYGKIRLTKIIPESSKAMQDHAFCRGHKVGGVKIL